MKSKYLCWVVLFLIGVIIGLSVRLYQAQPVDKEVITVEAAEAKAIQHAIEVGVSAGIRAYQETLAPPVTWYEKLENQVVQQYNRLKGD